MPVQSYPDLDVYQRARKLILPIYQLAERLPSDEKFDRRDQIRRACKSVVDIQLPHLTRPRRLP